tara:strand:- start:3135 stop:3341 length:207 start_codon:yes stop_codon:yes gene_type:complete
MYEVVLLNKNSMCEISELFEHLLNFGDEWKVHVFLFFWLVLIKNNKYVLYTLFGTVPLQNTVQLVLLP